jgi:hypothetical protein
MHNSKDDPFYCLPLTKEEHSALKCLQRGEATPGQQHMALSAIVNKLSRAHDILLIPGNPEGTGVLNGRAFVGMKILRYLNVPIGAHINEEEVNNQ